MADNPTPFRRAVLLAAIDNGGTVVPGTARPSTLAAMESAGWLTRATAVYAVTAAGYEAVGAEVPAADGPALSPDAAEQGPAADGPIITPELRRAVVAAAHAEAGARSAAERVDALRTAADLDQPYAIGDRVALIALPNRTGTVVGLGSGRPDGILGVRWDKPRNGVEVSGGWRGSFRRIDDQSAAVLDRSAADPVAAIVELIEQHGRMVAAQVSAGSILSTSPLAYGRQAADLLDRIRRTLADALDTRRHRELYTHLPAGRRLVACVHTRGVFEHCPDGCDDSDEQAAAEPVEVATVTVDADGRLVASSTLTIGNRTVPVPERAERGGMIAPRRIVEAMRSLGYRPVDYYNRMRPSPETLTIAWDVRPVGQSS